MTTIDAIVLSGGSARRLGGVRKTALVVGGRSVLGRLTAEVGAVVGASGQLVVVGDTIGADRVDVSTLEDPPGGGPVAAIAAGLRHVKADTVLLLAGDQPFVTAGVIRQLLDAVAEHDGAVAVDGDGRRHWLLAAWRTSSLRARIDVLEVRGAATRSLYASGGVIGVRFDGEPAPWADIDTPEDLHTARTRTEGRS